MRPEERTISNSRDDVLDFNEQHMIRRAMIGNRYFSRDDVLDFNRMVAIENVGISGDFQKRIIGTYKEKLGTTSKVSQNFFLSKRVTKLDSGTIDDTLAKVDRLVNLVEEIYKKIQKQFVTKMKESEPNGDAVNVQIDADDQTKLKTALEEVYKIMNRHWYRAGLTRNYQKGAISRIYEFAKYLCDGKEKKLANRAQIQQDRVDAVKFRNQALNESRYEERIINVIEASKNYFDFQEAKKDLEDIRKNLLDVAVMNSENLVTEVSQKDLDREKKEVSLAAQHPSSQDAEKIGYPIYTTTEMGGQVNSILNTKLKTLEETIMSHPSVWNSPSFRYLFRLYLKADQSARFMIKHSKLCENGIPLEFLKKIRDYLNEYFDIAKKHKDNYSDQCRYEFARKGKEIASELSNMSQENLERLNKQNYKHLKEAAEAKKEAKENGNPAPDKKKKDMAAEDYTNTYDYLLYDSTVPFFEAMDANQRENFALEVSSQQVLKEKHLTANEKNWADKIKWQNHPTEKAVKDVAAYSWGGIATAAQLVARVCSIQNIVTRFIFVDLPAKITQAARGHREGRQVSIDLTDPAMRERVKQELKDLEDNCMYGFTMIQQLPYTIRYSHQFYADIKTAKHRFELKEDGTHAYKYDNPNFRLVLNPLFDITVLGMHASNKYKNTQNLWKGIVDQYHDRLFTDKETTLKEAQEDEKQLAVMSVFEMAKEATEETEAIPGTDFLRSQALLGMIELVIDQSHARAEERNKKAWNEKIEEINEKVDQLAGDLRGKSFEELETEFEAHFDRKLNGKERGFIGQDCEIFIKYFLAKKSKQLQLGEKPEEKIVPPDEYAKEHEDAMSELKKMLSDALHSGQLTKDDTKRILEDISKNLRIEEGKKGAEGRDALAQVVFKDEFLLNEICGHYGKSWSNCTPNEQEDAKKMLGSYRTRNTLEGQQFSDKEKAIFKKLDALDPAKYIGKLIAGRVSLQEPIKKDKESEEEKKARRAKKRVLNRFKDLVGKIKIGERSDDPNSPRESAGLAVNAGSNKIVAKQPEENQKEAKKEKDNLRSPCESALLAVNAELNEIDKLSEIVAEQPKEKRKEAEKERLVLLFAVRLRWMTLRKELLQHNLAQLEKNKPDPIRQAIIKRELKQIEEARQQLIAAKTVLDKEKLKNVKAPLTAKKFKEKWQKNIKIEGANKVEKQTKDQIAQTPFISSAALKNDDEISEISIFSSN